MQQLPDPGVVVHDPVIPHLTAGGKGQEYKAVLSYKLNSRLPWDTEDHLKTKEA